MFYFSAYGPTHCSNYIPTSNVSSLSCLIEEVLGNQLCCSISIVNLTPTLVQQFRCFHCTEEPIIRRKSLQETCFCYWQSDKWCILTMHNGFANALSVSVFLSILQCSVCLMPFSLYSVMQKQIWAELIWPLIKTFSILCYLLANLFSFSSLLPTFWYL